MQQSPRIVQDTSRLLGFWAQLGRMLDVDGDWSAKYASENGLVIVPIEHHGYHYKDPVDKIFNAFATPGEKVLLTRAEFLIQSYAIVSPNYDSFKCGYDHYPAMQVLMVADSYQWGMIDTDEAYHLFLGKKSSFDSYLQRDHSLVLREVRERIESIKGEYPAKKFYDGIAKKYCQI